MKMYSDAFLNDSYLKYVGWTLHDRVSRSKHSPDFISRRGFSVVVFVPLLYPFRIRCSAFFFFSKERCV